MGTRGMNIIVIDKEIKCAQYNQFDSYPAGQGATTLEFLREEMHPDFKDKVKSCSWISQVELQKLWVEAGADPDSDMVSLDVSKKFKENNLHLHRDCGAQIYALIQSSENGLKLQNSIDFAGDSRFCEWLYVVDFDKNTFEVYNGDNSENLTSEDRFYFLIEDSRKEGGDCSPVTIVKSYSLDNLPTKEQLIQDLDHSEEE